MCAVSPIFSTPLPNLCFGIHIPADSRNDASSPVWSPCCCRGSYVTDQLTVFDWRFGVKVGVLPWRTYRRDDDDDDIDHDEATLAAAQALDRAFPQPPSPQPLMVQPPDIDEDLDLDDDDQSVVPPWGLEATMVLPPYWSDEPFPIDAEDYAQRGLRLIAVGDNRNDKLEIKVWDITYILRASWQPLVNEPEDPETETDQSWMFFWWSRGTTRLKRLALKMLREPEHVGDLHHLASADRGNNSADNDSNGTIGNTMLPYSAPCDTEPMILVHAFDKSDTEDMPVRYTAYNVLRTSLFLLTEEGKITVMDIETGRLTGSLENVVGEPGTVGPQRQSLAYHNVF
ncbi:hypothetical protein BX666DRAFT_182309 [Dichotomocladium elegans]|nr:hypothetical protein BX666DRAFT_182309 [Dichotomocladium elegans]